MPPNRAPTRPGEPIIQVFGTERSQETRGAIRFFKERRVAITFVDLRKRQIAAGELRRFVERLGASSLLDPASRSYRAAELAYLRTDEAGLVACILADPGLLRLPLVRRGIDVTVGPDETAWTEWIRSGAGPALPTTR